MGKQASKADLAEAEAVSANASTPEQEAMGYRIGSDKNNWIIEEMRRRRAPDQPAGEPASGEPYWVAIKWYGSGPNSLQQCALGLLSLLGKDNPNPSVLGLVVTARECTEYVVEEVRAATARAWPDNMKG